MSDDIHTTLPGKIISWNGELAVVQPSLPKKLSDDTALNAPQIVSVPVCFPIGAGGDAVISVPLLTGDPVTLHFSERSLENWLSGSDSAPDDPRRFDLTDCFATPVVRPNVGKCDTTNLSLSFGGGSIKITPSGDIEITGGNVTINGATAVQGSSLTHNGKNVGDTHTHGGITPGPANTGVPN